MRNIFFENIDHYYNETGELSETSTYWTKTLSQEKVNSLSGIHEGANNAIAYEYDFKKVDNIKYLVVKFIIEDELLINKYYVLNEGYNDEAIELLLNTRSFRSKTFRRTEVIIDFQNIFNYRFLAYITRDEDTKDFFLSRIKVKKDSYLENHEGKIITDIPFINYDIVEGDDEEDEIYL